MANCIHWLFGRGASIGCNLTWAVPSYLMHLSREQKIAGIKKELIEASGHPSVDTTVYRKLLNNLGSQTATGWRHRFEINGDIDLLTTMHVQQQKYSFKSN